jgi:hypothetical protein
VYFNTSNYREESDMKRYIFEYRNKNYEPKIVGVDATGKKDACKKAQQKIGKECYLVKHSIKSYACIQ